MPELPEVEIGRRQLQRWSQGRTVAAVKLPAPTSVRVRLSTTTRDAHPDPSGALAAVVGRATVAVRRHGKRMAWTFAAREGEVRGPSLLVHFGMSGRWLRRPADEAPPHGRVGFTFDDGAVVWLDDPRRFGCVVPLTGDAYPWLTEGLGPDALQAPLTAERLRERLVGRRPVKVALLDQTVLAGLGNIHAAEALFRAGVAPHTPCHALTDAQLRALARQVPRQLAAVVEAEDGDEVVYVSRDPARNPFVVYGRQGEPCATCGSAIERDRLGGRANYWCPGCQPVSSPGRSPRPTIEALHPESKAR